MSGDDWRTFRRGCLAVAVVILAIDTVNVLTLLHDSALVGRPLPLWLPMTWEYTSGAAVIAFCGLGYLGLRLAPPQSRRWWRTVGVHGVLSFGFSVLHVGGMNLLRIPIYAMVGRANGLRLSDFGYEYRKDLLAYVGIVALFWIFQALGRTPGAYPTPAPAPASTFDIAEGARILRTPVGEILAARSAGNYVEFLLVDGRRPLMRITLAKVHTALESHRFVRTHRFWIVNADRLRSIEPLGSGDFKIALEGGAEALLSRRFAAALDALRATPA